MLENLNITQIKPYEKNPRKNEKAIDKVAQSIKEFGFKQPIVIDNNNIIIAGHTRYQASIKLGLESVPVIKANDLSDEQVKAYRIADNRVAQEAEWDIDLLKMELADLKQIDYNLLETGFNQEELDKILQLDVEGLTDEDEVPETPKEPITKLGDIYKLGNHRLMCGDSTSIDSVEKLMDGIKSDLVFTDPPYNADYKSRGSNNLLRKGIKNDCMSDEDFDDFIDGFLSMLFAGSKEGASFYICCNWKDSYPRFYNHLTKAGMNVSSCIVWDKKTGGMGWQDYRYQYEFIIYGFKKDKAHTWYGGRTETDIWQFSRETRTEYVHPTQKPVILIEKALKNSSKSGDCILDLFGGSGSTLIACHKTNRVAYLMELDPKYCDVIVKRWENFTGEKAEVIHGKT